MTKSKDQTLHDLVNASGFVFQLGVEQRIRETKGQHRWEILSREHPWRSEEGSGFADLILGQGIIRVVIECKRTRDGTWVFLVPQEAKPLNRCRCQWFSHVPDMPDLSGWEDFPVEPNSLEADFCIIRGQGEGDRSLLERLADGLLDALPPFAIEEANLRSSRNLRTDLIYLPLIVTNAALEVCRMAPNDVDLLSGTLNNARFEPAKVVRFRKSLAHELTDGATPYDIGAVAKDKERTIMLCAAEYLVEFLKDLNVEGSMYNAPWVAARRLQNQG